jgi:hypothetical protein
MLTWLKRAIVAAALLAPPACALAAEPVKHIGIYVQPYYESATTPQGQPRVAIGRRLSALLGSNRPEDILAARDAIEAEPRLVTPMSLMVLAIRLYDIGLRDDAVFWFYAAKDRYGTLADVLDVPSSGLAQVEEAVRNFATLAGPFINGYAFCDLARQQALRAKALAWVEQNPYEAVFWDRFVAKPGNRRENLERAVRNARAGAEKERLYFADRKNLEEFYAARKKNDMDAKFCWQ